MKFINLRELTALFGISTLFLFEYFNLNLLNVIEPAIVKEFNCTNLQIGWLGSIYFYAMVALLVPAGFIIDRYKLYKIIIFSSVAGAMGEFLLALSQNYTQLLLSRAIVGCCLGPFALIACIKFISKIVTNKNKIGVYISIILFIGILGGALSQDLFGALVNSLGWRMAVFIIGISGAIISITLILTVNMFKNELVEKVDYNESFIGMIKLFITNSNILENIRLGVMASVLNLPLFVFGSLFGVAYLEQCYGILSMEAAHVTTYLFWGMLVGSVLFGMCSVRGYNQKTLLTLGALISLISLTFLMIHPSLNNVSLKILFFCLGISAGSHVLSFSLVEKITSYKSLGLAEGFHSAMIFLGGALIQPLFGKILDLSHQHITKADHYELLSPRSSYRPGLAVLLLLIILGAYFMNKPNDHKAQLRPGAKH